MYEMSKIKTGLAGAAMLCAALVAPAFAGEVRNVSFTFEMGEGGVQFGRVAGVDLPLASSRGLPTMNEPTLAKALASSVLAENEKGETIAIVAQLANHAGGMVPGLEGEVLWTVVVPGVGSLVGSGLEAVPDALAAAYEAIAQGETWSAGPMTAQLSVGPEAEGRGRIVGGTGVFEGARGTFARFVTLREVDGNDIEGRTELRFAIEE